MAKEHAMEAAKADEEYANEDSDSKEDAETENEEHISEEKAAIQS
ncbi:hypothetical protein [Butyrivibrio sp. AE3004]|nr:hypothetical protein [Butyrivibrio sp. AE3004]